MAASTSGAPPPPAERSPMERFECAVAELEALIHEDVGKRGIAAITLPGQLAAAATAFLDATGVVVLTGFPCRLADSPPTETDGPPGAIALAAAALKLGKRAAIATDTTSAAVLTRCAEAAGLTALGDFELFAFPPRAAWTPAHDEELRCVAAAYDHAVAIERAGAAVDGSYYTMRALNMDHLVAPIDELITRDCASGYGLPAAGGAGAGDEGALASVAEEPSDSPVAGGEERGGGGERGEAEASAGRRCADVAVQTDPVPELPLLYFSAAGATIAPRAAVPSLDAKLVPGLRKRDLGGASSGAGAGSGAGSEAGDGAPSPRGATAGAVSPATAATAGSAAPAGGAGGSPGQAHAVSHFRGRAPSAVNFRSDLWSRTASIASFLPPLITRTSTGIGDGGNECGMGKVLAAVQAHITNGATIACATPADNLITAGVSNWGGWALAAAVEALLRAKVMSKDAATPSGGLGAPTAAFAGRAGRRRTSEGCVDFMLSSLVHAQPRGFLVPTEGAERTVADAMAAAHARDGITGAMDGSVDGMPLDTHIALLLAVRRVLIANFPPLAAPA